MTVFIGCASDHLDQNHIRGYNMKAARSTGVAKKWIQGAIKKPGALRATAKRAGMVEGKEKLSESDLGRLSAKAKRVNLARTLRKLRKSK